MKKFHNVIEKLKEIRHYNGFTGQSRRLTKQEMKIFFEDLWIGGISKSSLDIITHKDEIRSEEE